MFVLGINSYVHDSSAALISDGKLVFALEEERLSRVKKDARFPKLAIQAALDYAGIRISDLDAVAFGWNRSGVTPLHTLRSSLVGELPLSASYVVQSLLQIVREVYHDNGRRPLERVFGRPKVPAIFVDHHESHAWSAYALSGFEESMVIVTDGRGATQATTIYHARGEQLTPVRTYHHPNSLGAYYEAFTDLLGFERANDEWKVMGLAAYGKPTHDLSDILQVKDYGYRIDSSVICGKTWGDISALTRRFGPRRNPEVRITEDDRNLAASVQKGLEKAMFALVRDGIRLTGCRRLCLAGGVAMNSKANGRLLESGLIDDIFVQPAATDDGAAIGAAIGAHRSVNQPIPRYRLTDVYLGPESSDADIESALRTYKLSAHHLKANDALVAGLLADGKIVGWFQGRMEFGPRALGNRSILGDPRRPDMKDRVNESVKFREGWRPFAPSVLEEAAHEYFAKCHDAPYMIMTSNVLPEKRHVIPAVTHADNTARVQTVSRETNPRYWGLINEFGKLTGVPVLLNTSFNLRGEPIVCTPKDAIRTFYSSGLDFLVLGNFVLSKDPDWKGKATQNREGEATREPVEAFAETAANQSRTRR
jgi:carbamoyltransferase